MTQNTSENVKNSEKEPIAIIGIGCRFPGDANGPEAFWKLLRDGVDAITEVSEDTVGTWIISMTRTGSNRKKSELAGAAL